LPCEWRISIIILHFKAIIVKTPILLQRGVIGGGKIDFPSGQIMDSGENSTCYKIGLATLQSPQDLENRGENGRK
jgi:hypothetical protein